MPQGPAAPIIPMVLVVRGREIADEYSVLLRFFDLHPQEVRMIPEEVIAFINFRSNLHLKWFLREPGLLQDDK